MDDAFDRCVEPWPDKERGGERVRMLVLDLEDLPSNQPILWSESALHSDIFLFGELAKTRNSQFSDVM
jgi:hypothetical protein